eukprot:6172423-Amphidinium_carterae.1
MGDSVLSIHFHAHYSGSCLLNLDENERGGSHCNIRLLDNSAVPDMQYAASTQQLPSTNSLRSVATQRVDSTAKELLRICYAESLESRVRSVETALETVSQQVACRCTAHALTLATTILTRCLMALPKVPSGVYVVNLWQSCGHIIAIGTDWVDIVARYLRCKAQSPDFLESR